MQTRLAVLLFTDIVGSTAIKQRLGDRGYAPVKRQHDVAIAEAIEATAEPTGSEAMGGGAATSSFVKCSTPT